MTETEQKPRKGGRPSKPEGKTVSKTMNFRVPPKLYQQVVEAATADDISISEEVGRRLSQSFFQDDLLKARFGSDPSIAFLANLFASILNTINEKTGKSCITDSETREAARLAFDHVLASSEDIMKDVSDVPAMQRRFDREDFRRLIEARIDDAAFHSIEHERLSLSDIMGQ